MKRTSKEGAAFNRKNRNLRDPDDCTPLAAKDRTEVAAQLTRRIEWMAQRAATPADVRIVVAIYERPRQADEFAAPTRSHLRPLEKAGVIEWRSDGTPRGGAWHLTLCDCKVSCAVKHGLCDYCGGPQDVRRP